MKSTLRWLSMFVIAAFSTGIILAQKTEVNRAEVFAGYSFESLDTGLGDLNEEIGEDVFDNRVSMHGFNASATGNFHKYLGVKVDFSYHLKNDSFSAEGTTLKLKYSTTQFLGGLQIKNNLKDGPRFKPFAHILAGVAHQNLKGTFSGGESPDNFSEGQNDFAMVFGGGLDIRASKHIDIRVIQFDYNPIFEKGNDNFVDEFSIPGRTQNNIRLSFGIVFH